MTARIAAVSVHLPERVVTNADLIEEFPDWSVEKIASKTGIESRHIAGDDEYSSDLAVGAVQALVREHGVDLAAIDFLIVCTQTPDQLMPAVSSVVHGALGLRPEAGAMDINLGCSGYVYGLGMASALLDSGQASRILLVTADTYSRLLNPADRSVRTIFGDGATATLLEPGESSRGVHSFVYGSQGSGGGALATANGGIRPAGRFPAADPAARGFAPSEFDLYMDGTAVFNFTLDVVPPTVDRVLASAGIGRDDVDTWIFHQANRFMLGHLRRKLAIPEEQFLVDMADVGNTVSSTIPIVISRAKARGELPEGTRSVLLGFGVGLSWAGAVVDW